MQNKIKIKRRKNKKKDEILIGSFADCVKFNGLKTEAKTLNEYLGLKAPTMDNNQFDSVIIEQMGIRLEQDAKRITELTKQLESARATLEEKSQIIHGLYGQIGAQNSGKVSFDVRHWEMAKRRMSYVIEQKELALSIMRQLEERVGYNPEPQPESSVQKIYDSMTDEEKKAFDNQKIIQSNPTCLNCGKALSYDEGTFVFCNIACENEYRRKENDK